MKGLQSVPSHAGGTARGWQMIVYEGNLHGLPGGHQVANEPLRRRVNRPPCPWSLEERTCASPL
jgi:hypothetical protein